MNYRFKQLEIEIKKTHKLNKITVTTAGTLTIMFCPKKLISLMSCLRKSQSHAQNLQGRLMAISSDKIKNHEKLNFCLKIV